MTSLTSEMLQTLERRIRERTWGRIRDLHVERIDAQVFIRGGVPTYYLKQLVLEAAREVLGRASPLRIDIEVD
jgi:hypothetical protein